MKITPHINKKLIAFVAGVFIMVIIAFAWTKGADDAQGEIRIGALLCMTGSCAEWGEGSLAGIELAVHEVNENGGLLGQQLEVVMHDTQEDALAKVPLAFQAMMLQEPDVIIGPTWTPAGHALAPIAADSETIMISPSLGVVDFKNTSNNLFNTWPADKFATGLMADFAYHELGWRTVAIMSGKQAWVQEQGNVFGERFAELGGEIVFKAEPLQGEKDFKTALTQIISLDPDGVMFSNLIDMDIIARELRSKSFKKPFISILMDDTRIENAQGALEGTIYIQQPQVGAEFTKAFEEEYGTQPTVSADTAYDAVMWYARAVRQAGSLETLAVQKAMNSFDTLEAATGRVATDGHGGVTKEPVFWNVEGGEGVLY